MSAHGDRRCATQRGHIAKTVLGLIGALAFGSAPVFAGEVTGRIEYLQSGHGLTPDDAYVLVKMSAPIISPGCPADPRFAINPTTNAGKVLVALLTAAKASGATVYLVGTGTCLASNYELVSWMRILD